MPGPVRHSTCPGGIGPDWFCAGAIGVNFKKTGQRNRKIFAAHENGESIEKLARRHKLSSETVQHILAAERHKIAVSLEAFYKEIRLQKLRPQT